MVPIRTWLRPRFRRRPGSGDCDVRADRRCPVTFVRWASGSRRSGRSPASGFRAEGRGLLSTTGANEVKGKKRKTWQPHQAKSTGHSWQMDALTVYPARPCHLLIAFFEYDICKVHGEQLAEASPPAAQHPLQDLLSDRQAAHHLPSKSTSGVFAKFLRSNSLPCSPELCCPSPVRKSPPRCWGRRNGERDRW